MKVVFVIPSLHVGGMERVMSRLLNGFVLIPDVTELHLVLFGRNRDIFYDVPSKVQIHRPNFEFNNKIRFFHTIRTIFFLRKTIKELNPASILSFGERWNNMVLLAGLGLSWPVYVSDRCQPNKSLGRFHDLLRKYLYPKAKGVVAQTQQAKEIFESIYNHSNISVIGNPVMKAPHVEEERRENIVLSVGRLIDSKHHDELINIFNRIANKNWKLVIVGGDALQQQNLSRLTDLVNNLGLETNVILTGSIKDVSSWYKKAKVFAFPSSSEGFPNVVGEALAYGIPTVAFDCIAGPRDLIEDGRNGYLVDVFDFKTFEVRLQKLMDDEELRKNMSEVAVSSIEKFDEQNMINNYFETLRFE